MNISPHSIIARDSGAFLVGTMALAVLMVCGFVSFVLSLIVAFARRLMPSPKRVAPHGENIVLSPADGHIVAVEKVNDPYLQRAAIKVSVFMNIFNAHANNSPVDGYVQKIWYYPGKLINTVLDKASSENERNAVWLKTKSGADVMLVQVAGLIARRVLCFVRTGDVLNRGQRYGGIRFGSRIDVYLPADAKVKARIGDKVSATTSILATLAK